MLLIFQDLRSTDILRLKKGRNINPTQDFLSMMLVGQQKKPDGIFSDILIKNQCLLQLWASHYQVSGFVSSLIYQLGKYPLLLSIWEHNSLKLASGFSWTNFLNFFSKTFSFMNRTRTIRLCFYITIINISIDEFLHKTIRHLKSNG